VLTLVHRARLRDTTPAAIEIAEGVISNDDRWITIPTRARADYARRWITKPPRGGSRGGRR